MRFTHARRHAQSREVRWGKFKMLSPTLILNLV